MELNPDQNSKLQNYCFPVRKIFQTTHHFSSMELVEKVNEQNHLGLFLDSKLTFERHVNEKMIKAKYGIAIIKYISKFFPIKILDQMYKAFVRSHLDYCDIIYHLPGLNNETNLGNA